MTESFNVTFTHRRCYDCGTFWAIEADRKHREYLCPLCAYKQQREHFRTVEKLERRVRALRGHLTRKSK